MLCIKFIIRMRAPIQFIDFSVSNLYKSNGDIMLLSVRVRDWCKQFFFFIDVPLCVYRVCNSFCYILEACCRVLVAHATQRVVVVFGATSYTWMDEFCKSIYIVNKNAMNADGRFDRLNKHFFFALVRG